MGSISTFRDGRDMNWSLFVENARQIIEGTASPAEQELFMNLLLNDDAATTCPGPIKTQVHQHVAAACRVLYPSNPPTHVRNFVANLAPKSPRPLPRLTPQPELVAIG